MTVDAESSLRGRLEALAAAAGVEIAPGLADRLCAYVELLRRWNAKLNLTRLDADDNGLWRLVGEPLAAVPFLPPRGALIDIGAGAGSPAIPLKLARPELALRLVESKARKAAFLREAVRSLGLKAVEVEDARYERLTGRRELQEAHEVLTVRGVRLDAPALRALRVLVASGGSVLWFRGAGAAAELAEAAGFAVESSTPLVGSDGNQLVVLRRPTAPAD